MQTDTHQPRASNRVNEDFEEARTRKTTAEADIKEMEVAQAAGALIPAKEVQATWTDILVNIKAKLLVLPVKYATLTQHENDPRVIEDIGHKLIDEALHELAQYDPSENGKRREPGKTSDVSAETPTKAKRKRVGRPRKATKLRG